MRFRIILSILGLAVSGCSDIALIKRGDDFFNDGNYRSAVTEYEKVVLLTADKNSPYYTLPTGEEARKKIEISNLAILSKDQFEKGNKEFWNANMKKAADHYRLIDPQFLSATENRTYEKNRKEILGALAPTAASIIGGQSPREEPAARASNESSPLEEVTSAAPQTSPHHYFPLRSGWKYRYRSSIPIGTKTVYQTMEEEILAEEMVRERRIVPVRRTQPGQEPDTHYYEIQGEEIHLVAERKAGQNQPAFYEFPLIEIKSPVEVGSSWVVQGVPRVIIGLENVSVISGRYPNCLKVLEQSSLVKTIRWYAPEIGLVKWQKITFPGKSQEFQTTHELALLEK